MIDCDKIEQCLFDFCIEILDGSCIYENNDASSLVITWHNNYRNPIFIIL